MLLLVFQALAQPSSRTPNTRNTHSVGPTVDIVPPATETPTPTPSPTAIPPVISPIEPPVYYHPPRPTVHVARVVTTITPLGAKTLCYPDDTNSFLIRATITVSNPVGGTVTYHWLTNDGFTSVPLQAVFQPGETTQTVTDTWTMGAMYADGRPKWEKAIVTGPNAVVSNPATFIVTCPAIISGLQVQAVRVPSNCEGVAPGYDVTATVTVFAPAGGSFTYQMMNKDSTGTYTEEKTIIIPPGQLFTQAVAKWHIGDPNGPPDGVTVTTGTGMVLSSPMKTGTETGDGTPTPTPTTTPTPTPTPTPTTTPTTTPTPTATPTCPPSTTQFPMTVDGLTIVSAQAALDKDSLPYNCPTKDTPQQFTFHGKIAVDTTQMTQPGTISYRWVRPDGTLGPEETLNVAPGDTMLATVDDTWTQAPSPADGAYSEQIVITAINGQQLATPLTSLYGQYWVLCAPQPTPQTN
jgi:hypothetical protein